MPPALWDIELLRELSVGELLVAIGTLLLAGFTAGLAWFTARLARQTAQEVEQSRQEIAMSRESIEAADRPFVIATGGPQNRTALSFYNERDDLNVHTDRWALAFRFWNIGKGPALVWDLSLIGGDGSELLEPAAGEIPLASQDELGTTWPLADRDRLPEDGDGELRIYYRSGSGLRYVTTQKSAMRGERVTCSDYRRIDRDTQTPSD